MRLPELHARLLADVLAIGCPYPLVITGGYAVQAHELSARLNITDTRSGTQETCEVDVLKEVFTRPTASWLMDPCSLRKT